MIAPMDGTSTYAAESPPASPNSQPDGGERRSLMAVSHLPRRCLSSSEVESAIRDEIPLLDTVVHHDRLFEGAARVVLGLFPEWDEGGLHMVQCKDGITNKLVKVTHSGSNNRQEVVLVRAYGKKSEVLIDRHQEIVNMVTLSKLGLCPPLYGRWTNGLAYGYIPGKVCTSEDLTEPEIGRAVARSLRVWHSVEVADPDEPTQNGLVTAVQAGGKPGAVGEVHRHRPKLFDTLRRWMAEVPFAYQDLSKNALFQSRFDHNTLRRELENLQLRLQVVHSPVVFCHCDLLAANIIYDDAKKEASFIDYEYGAWSYRGFDIGNHWNEWAGLECDYSRFPCREKAFQWLREYAGDNVSAEELEALYQEACKFALASHFYWGLWALVQASVSDIDFDYMQYAILRFDEFDRRKEEFLRI